MSSNTHDAYTFLFFNLYFYKYQFILLLELKLLISIYLQIYFTGNETVCSFIMHASIIVGIPNVFINFNHISLFF